MNKKIVKTMQNLLLNIVGSSLLAFGVCAFIIPFDFIVGGATGIALISHKLTGIEVSKIALLINMVVLIPGWIFGGKRLVLGSVLSSLVYPVALAVFEKIPQITTLVDNAIMAAICGGVICGAGIALVMRSGGSTGGLDIPVLLVHKYLHVPVNTMMNATDICIMLFQIPFSVVTNVIYGIFYTYIMTTALKKVLEFGSERMRVTIVSEHYEEIRAALIANDFGLTMLYAEGGYTKTPIQKVESVMLSDHVRKAKRIIEETDPEAFVTIERVLDVRGRGYTMERIMIELDD